MHQRLMNRSAKPAIGPECSVPAIGCAGTKCTPAGRCGAMSRTIAALDRADVGEDGARLEVGCDLLRDRAAGADRDAEDDKVGVSDGFARWSRPRGRRCRAPATRARVFAERAVVTISRPAPAPARRARSSRRSAQSRSARFCRSAARRSLGRHEIAQAVDHQPVGLFGADGQAQRMRQAVIVQRRAAPGRVWSRNASRLGRGRGPCPAGNGSGQSSPRSASP